MLEKEFVPYQESLELKELGFDEPCICYYDYVSDFESVGSFIKNCELDEDETCAPTFSQTFRWFREKYGLKSWVEEHTKESFIYQIRPHKLTDYKEGEVYVYKIHEEAELACLRKLIEIANGKQ